MRPAVRYATLRLSPRVFAPRASPMTSCPDSSFWICERCYHQSQRALHLKKAALPSKPLTARRVSSAISRSWYERRSQLQIRPSSTNSKDAADKIRQDLPSQEEGRRSHLAKRASHLMDSLQSNIFIAGQRLNDLTGYSGIEALKKDIEQQELLVQNTRRLLQEAREAYSKAISQRSGSQREVNELLQRKHGWSPADLERFTTLYRSDHANEQAEAAAQDYLVAVERKAEDAATKLSASILARYHEEQIWSDKIRRMSTWGTWGLMGVNILLFVLFQIGVEPWRRKRLVKGFEEKVMEALDREGLSKGSALGEERKETGGSKAIDAILNSEKEVTEYVLPNAHSIPGDSTLAMTVELSPVSPKIEEMPEIPRTTIETVREKIRDMFSEREIVLRRVDLTTATLEGAAAGVAFIGVLVLLLRPQ